MNPDIGSSNLSSSFNVLSQSRLGGEEKVFLVKVEGLFSGRAADVSVLNSESIKGTKAEAVAILAGDTLAVNVAEYPQLRSYVGTTKELTIHGEDGPRTITASIRAMTTDEEKEVDELFKKIMLQQNPQHVEGEKHEEDKHKDEHHKEDLKEHKISEWTKADGQMGILERGIANEEKRGRIFHQIQATKEAVAKMEEKFSENARRSEIRHESKMMKSVEKAQKKARTSFMVGGKEINNDRRSSRVNQSKTDSEDTVDVTSRAEVIREGEDSKPKW